ncbi:MAG: class I SAM-dependent methyltransferase, partial [Ignavibacterium sp.]|nr:class I SAM-dependent methyltransferase [Ignavibacterium sp.]
MNLSEIIQLPVSDGVHLFEKDKNQFEEKYLAIRRKEKRLYSDGEVKLLPFASLLNPHKKEWEYRSRSFIRFKEYLKSFRNELEILDLGCGNGWFAGELSKEFQHNFYCIDINLYELKQGARIFKNDKIKFIYGNIIQMELEKNSFDLIVLNSSVQYFSDFNLLIKELVYILKLDGEIHIIDSPFYENEKLSEAKQRTEAYYKSIGFPEMKDFYFHHSYKDVMS